MLLNGRVYPCVFNSLVVCPMSDFVKFTVVFFKFNQICIWFSPYLVVLRVLRNCTCSLKAPRTNAHLLWQSRLLESVKDDCCECFPNCMQSWKWIPNPAWSLHRQKNLFSSRLNVTLPEREKQANIRSNSHQAQLCIPQPAKQNRTNWWLLNQYGLCSNYLVIVIKISQGYQELIEVSYYYGTRKLWNANYKIDIVLI